MLVAEAWYFNYVLPLLIRLRRGLIMLSGFAGRLMRWLALRAIMLKKHSALIGYLFLFVFLMKKYQMIEI